MAQAIFASTSVIVAALASACGIVESGPPDAATPDAASDANSTHIRDATSHDATNHDARPDAAPLDVVAHDAAACIPPSLQCGTACINPATDVQHCGTCTTDCTTLAHVDETQTTCQGGTCVPICAPGYANCDDAGGGCTTSLSSPATCGSCATTCTGDTPACTPVVLGDAGADAAPEAGAVACTSGCTPATNSRCDGVCVDETANVNNCGTCGSICDGVCLLGRCLVTLAQTLTNVPAPGSTIAVNATDVYWVTGHSSSPSWVPKTGGTVGNLVSDAGSMTGWETERLTTSANTAYWSTESEMFSAPLTGGALATLVPHGNVLEIAVAEGNLYWTDPFENAVMAVAMDGGAPVTFAGGAGEVEGLAAGNGNVYWTDGSSILSMPVTGGVVATVAAGVGEVALVNVDANNAYWATGIGGSEVIMSVPLVGGTQRVLVSGIGAINGFVVDAQSVYWGDGWTGTITSIPLTGGSPTTVAQLQAVSDLAIDDTSVYCLTGTALVRVTPK